MIPPSPTSRARLTFDNAIEDAVSLLHQFDAVHKDQTKLADALKRASLVMALTAWETYVEDRIKEAVQMRLKAVSGSPIGKFVSGKLEEELKRFHNPTSEKTRKLFLDYLEIDVTAGWKWQHFEPAPFQPLPDDVALPCSVRGPVDCSHGLQFLIALACCCRWSGVHLRAAIAEAL